MCVCNPVLEQCSPSGSVVWTMATHARCLASVLVMFVVCLRAHVQFCWFDKADATADVQ